MPICCIVLEFSSADINHQVFLQIFLNLPNIHSGRRLSHFLLTFVSNFRFNSYCKLNVNNNECFLCWIWRCSNFALKPFLLSNDAEEYLYFGSTLAILLAILLLRYALVFNSQHQKPQNTSLIIFIQIEIGLEFWKRWC